jgi:hypothetical protein
MQIIRIIQKPIDKGLKILKQWCDENKMSRNLNKINSTLFACNIGKGDKVYFRFSKHTWSNQIIVFKSKQIIEG